MKKLFFVISAFFIISCSAYDDGNSNKVTIIWPDDPVVSDPSGNNPETNPEPAGNPLGLSSEGGIYSSAFRLTITPSVSGNKIYYTTDGSKATLSSLLYSTGIQIYDSSTKTSSSQYNLVPDVVSYSGNYNYGYLGKGVNLNLLEVDSQGNEVSRKIVTYIAGSDVSSSDFPVICITAPEEVWFGSDGKSGLYNLRPDGDNDEKYRAFIEYYDPVKNESFALETQIKRGGNWTRNYPVRTINVNYRKDDSGKKNVIPYADIFDGRTKSSLNGEEIRGLVTRFRLHSGGNDTYSGFFTDAFVQNCVSEWNRNPANTEKIALATTAYRPCLLYLNGEAWGLYALREHYSAEYLEYNYGVNKDNVLFVDKTYNGLETDPLYARYNFEVQEGKQSDCIAALDELYAVLGYDWETGTVTDSGDWENEDSESYRRYCQLVDIDGLIDYILVHGYISDYDFMFNNFRMWRTLEAEAGNEYADTKWRFMLHDTDMAFQDSSADDNLTGTKWNWDSNTGKSYFDFYLGNAPLSHGSIGVLPLYNHLMLSQPAKNPQFKKRLMERSALVEQVFEPVAAKSILNKMKNEISSQMQERAKRWGYSYSTWTNAVSTRAVKITDRPHCFIPQVKSAFGITD